MITLVNLSGGNLHVESLGLVVEPGGRWGFDCLLDELLVKAPELLLYQSRGRVALEAFEEKSEDPKGS